MADRDFILNEIRRCAEENGGVVLGRERFEAITGIRESEWAGRYWINWSDAVVEAGYEPNQWNQAHADEHLLHQLALLARDLGRFPVENELRMRRRTDPDFPSANSFGRLGKKAERVERLRAWCNAHDGFEDVAALCVGRPDAVVSAEPVDDGDAGIVYLLHSKTRGYKLGMTSSMPRRWAEIQKADSGDVELLHYFRTVDAPGIESYWLRRFKAQNLRGEWFTLSSAQAAEFKRRSKSM
ncbi:MAG: GIY-YIG nuclease family protein [Actinomycetota bacterium]|nr:GIY-YIG nuclease family protein [Actinomycetota bacterium]